MKLLGLLLLAHSATVFGSATETIEDSTNLRGGRQLQGNNAEVECIEAAHKFRFAYCDALRTTDQTAWINAAPDFLAPDITTVFNIPGNNRVYTNIDDFLDPVTGFISALKFTIIGDYKSCIITFGANTRVLSQTNDKITVGLPNVKALSWSNSVPQPPFSPGGPGTLIEYDDDEYTCVKVNGKWKIQEYDDPNTIVKFA